MVIIKFLLLFIGYTCPFIGGGLVMLTGYDLLVNTNHKTSGIAYSILGALTILGPVIIAQF